MTLDYAQFAAAAEYVKSKLAVPPEIAVILGSGLGALADEIENPITIPYGDIPNFLVSTAPSHAGRLIAGTLAGKNIICMAGRFHYYEGYDYPELTLPIRLFHLLGVKAAILTNAAGAINETYHPGDVMLISDHLNTVGASPMRGKNIDAFGPRFFDVGSMYTPSLRALAKECARRTTLRVHEGIYMFFVGPHFETPAEIRAARILGADAAGMSTVTEALTAAHCGMKVLGLSLMTNMAAGILEQPLSGDDVNETAESVAVPFRAYVKDILAHMEL